MMKLCSYKFIVEPTIEIDFREDIHFVLISIFECTKLYFTFKKISFIWCSDKGGGGGELPHIMPVLLLVWPFSLSCSLTDV